jgi:Polysaccharide lyase
MRYLATTATAAVLLISVVAPSAAGASAGNHGAHQARHHSPVQKRLHGRRKAARSHAQGAPRRGIETSSSGSPASGIGNGTPVDPASGGGSSSTNGTSTTKNGSRPAEPTTPTPPAAPAPVGSPAPAPGNGSIIWNNNFEGGWNGSYVQSLVGRATISTAHPYEGSGAARFEVRPGDVEPDTGSERSEVVGPTFNEGQEIYIRDAIRLPASYTYQGSWELINQLHEAYWGGPPGVATMLDSNRRIDLQPGSGDFVFWRGPQLELERWYDLVYRIKLSQDPSQGFVEVWLDGVHQTMANGQTQMFQQTMQAAQTYFKAGIYRCGGSTGISVIEDDDIVIGTSLEAVMSV